MKSLTAVCQTGASGMPAINPNGRITRHPPHRGDGENAEMKMYLSKLKDLVPFMPKNRKLSKLEIIQHVIDYICDLQTELETHPEINNFDAAAALSSVAHAAAAAEDDDDDDDMMNLTEADNNNDMLVAQRLAAEQQLQLQQQQEQQQQLTKISSPAARMPLIDRQSPNTIVKVSSSSSSTSTSVSSLATSPVVTASAPVQQQQQQLPSQPQLANSLTTHLNAEKDSRQS